MASSELKLRAMGVGGDALLGELCGDAFWRGAGVHVAVPPGCEENLEELRAVVAGKLPEGGCLFRTSGTEGRPKWVGLEKRAFLHSARVVNAHYGLGERDRWLVVLPLHHVGGFSICARAWLAGSEVFRDGERWCPQRFVLVVRELGITAVSLVPTQVYDLVAAGLSCPLGMRLCLVGGAGLKSDLAEAARGLGWPLRRTFGMTETASQVASDPHECHEDARVDGLEILPHWEARVNEEGCLMLRGPALARGYVEGSDDGKWVWREIDQEVGLLTRDHVELWQCGTRSYLRPVGRAGGMLKILGELVSLEGVTERLRAVAPPGVQRFLAGRADGFCVVPMEDERRGHVLCLVVEEGCAEADVEAWLAAFHEVSAGFEMISHWDVVDQLPRTELGKLKLGELQERV
jgi:O-succinylbenzoic acid--CoA ligase